jgi:ubiquinone/menaquinone biosynthesis C-methylase UbiE/uncharacterized protein YbaR (Trm112 family)
MIDPPAQRVTQHAQTRSGVDRLDDTLRSILCCPACRGDLSYAPESNELACPACTFVFPIIDGIPILFPMNVKEHMEELFGRYWDSEERAHTYDEFVEGRQSMLDMHTHRGEIIATMEVLGDLPPGLLLDCGCGNGRFFEQLPQHVTAVGADASLNLLRICRAKGRCTRLVCCEIEHLPFKAEAFDRTLSVRVLQHLKQQREAVGEMVRVLKPQGVAVLHCYNELSSKAFVKHIREGRLGVILNFPFTKLFRSLSPFRPWPIPYDKYNTLLQVRRWLSGFGAQRRGARGAGFGFNKWLLSGFLISAWMEKRAPRVLAAYFSVSLAAENGLGRVWPLYHVMEKFVVKAVKT